jgi:ariadne-1
MNSDDEMYSAENSDSHEEEDEGDDVDVDDEYVMTLDHESASAIMKTAAGEDDEFEDDFRYSVLTADQIVQHMRDCVKEVNTVVQVIYLISIILLVLQSSVHITCGCMIAIECHFH